MSRRLLLTAEHGFTMAAVMLVMLATTILAAATFAAVGADIPFARESQDRKQAYAAAEAGVEYYLYQLTRDNDFWKTCASAVRADGQPNPVNLKDPGAARRWRTIPRSGGARFSIELLPANGAPQCSTATPELTLLDRGTGSFRIRSTGVSNGVRRSIVTTVRRASFLDYLYFTDYEMVDPLNFADTADAERAVDCVLRRAQRNQDAWCAANTNITFPDWDAIRGPLHTNDDLLTCGSPEFGRAGKTDRIGISGPAPNGWTRGNGCSGSPIFRGVKQHPADQLPVPESNAQLAAAALTGYTFYGQTDITLKSTGLMDVRSYNPNTGALITQTNMALPSNGVIYVEKFGGCSIDPPKRMDYSHGSGCAVLTVRGVYTKSMTLGSSDDILIDGNLTRSGDVVLGLIAQRFVRVKHDVEDTCGDNVGTPTNITIEAAMLALNDSFLLDNWQCGAPLGTLTVNGAIAQRFRGAVGMFSGTTKLRGYTKDYNYDDRLRYRSPPYFLDPVKAAWRVVRNNEQVPAAQ
jgi:hypothetical protein